jgi:EPS-associated MarR family transcriptional regulator
LLQSFKFDQKIRIICACHPCLLVFLIQTVRKNTIQEDRDMTSRQAKLQEDTNFRVMKLLQDNADLNQRELAKKLGISLGCVNYCLNSLTAKGLIKMQNFSQSKNKFGYVYLLTPTGITEKASLTSRFLKRKIDEYEALKAEIDALAQEIAEQKFSKEEDHVK